MSRLTQIFTDEATEWAKLGLLEFGSGRGFGKSRAASDWIRSQVKSSSDTVLHVIAVISNPQRWATRYELYQKFAKALTGPNVKLWTVEAAFGERSHEVTDLHNRQHHQVHIHSEVWHKENLINLGLRMLTRQEPNWKYVAWIDADVEFFNSNWVDETIHALQHHRVVQPWSQCIDLGPKNEALQMHHSFCSQYVEHGAEALKAAEKAGYGGTRKVVPAHFGHPGYAWAARREAIDGLGGLMDWPILGAADHHMAWAFASDVTQMAPKNLQPSYYRRLAEFQARADRAVKGDLGYIPGTIHHGWHGKKAARKYVERWQVLIDCQFDPDHDIVQDSQGVWQLVVESPRQRKLRDSLRRYFRQRNEDSIDL